MFLYTEIIMTSLEKHNIGQDTNIALKTRASLLYNKSSTLKSLTLLIPLLGSAIDFLVGGSGNKYEQRRIDYFLQELTKKLKALEEININCSDEEVIYDTFISTLDRVKQTRSNEKIQFFANIIADSLSQSTQWEEAEALSKLINELTEHHVNILKEALNSEPEHGRKAIYFNEVITDSDKNSKYPTLNYLTKPALYLYFSELISRGLLYDRGVGGLSSGSLDKLEPTELAEWFISKII